MRLLSMKIAKKKTQKWMVCQNVFEANEKSSFTVSTNSCHIQVFAVGTQVTAFLFLASHYWSQKSPWMTKRLCPWLELHQRTLRFLHRWAPSPLCPDLQAAVSETEALDMTHSNCQGNLPWDSEGNCSGQLVLMAQV